MPDTCADIESIRRVVRAAGWRRIGIDGVEGAGKPYLAGKLSETLSCPTLDLDDYLFRNQGGYADFIDYPALAAALSSMPSFILCGVCLREVLQNLGMTIDAHVYIKRMRDGLWADEDLCVFPDGVDAAIENFANHSAMISRGFDERSDQSGQDIEEPATDLWDEIMRYHDHHQPHELADLIYERADA